MSRIVISIVLILIALYAFAGEGSCDMYPKTIEFVPFDDVEAQFVYQNNAYRGELKTPFRFADGHGYWIYRFPLGKGSSALLTLRIGAHYLVSISPDGRSFTPVLDCEIHGRYVDDRTIDLSPVLAVSDEAYVKIEDRFKHDGWGGNVTFGRLIVLSGGDEGFTSEPFDISKNWQVHTGREDVTIHAGNAFQVDPKGKITISKRVLLPESIRTYGQEGYPIVLQFSGIHGSGTVFVNDLELGRIIQVDRPLSFALPENVFHKDDLEIRIELEPNEHWTSDTISGLWSPVVIGFEPLDSTVMAERSFDGKTIVGENQYGPYSLVRLNSLAGNALQWLFDERLGLLKFGPEPEFGLHFVHDSLRAIVALADEAEYSPIVRLELIKGLWEGVLRARIPTSSYEFFLKHDENAIDIRPSEDVGKLQITTPFDRRWDVATISVKGVIDSDGERVEIDGFNVKDTAVTSDGDYYQFVRTYSFDVEVEPQTTLLSRVVGVFKREDARKAQYSGEIVADIRYSSLASNIPPEVRFTSKDVDGIRITVGDLSTEGQWFIPGMAPNLVEFGDGTQIDFRDSKRAVVQSPELDYVIVFAKSGQSFGAGLLVCWTGSPALVEVKKGITGFTGVELYYRAEEGSVSGSIKVVPFKNISPDLNYVRYVARSIRENGTTGTDGFDPGQTVNVEGLGSAGLCAAAYILHKYGDPDAEHAINVAKEAIDGAIEAEKNGTRSLVLLHNIIAVEYMVKMGFEEYRQQAEVWGDRILSMQAGDGTFTWLDFQVRNMEALLRAYEITGKERFLEGFNKALQTLEYTEDGVRWKGNLVAFGSYPFWGGVDLTFLPYLGRMDVVDLFLSKTYTYVGDAGIFFCVSDINPYYLGYSLKHLNLQHDKKYVLSMNEFALYDESSVEILHAPTITAPNPHYPDMDTRIASRGKWYREL